MLSGEWNARWRESVEKFRRVLGGGVGGWNKVPLGGETEEAEALVSSHESSYSTVKSFGAPSKLGNFHHQEAIRSNSSKLKTGQDPENSFASPKHVPVMKMIDDEEPLIIL
jgi:hypothetical protein